MGDTAGADEPRCVFNGVDGVTGGYLVAPAPPGSLPVGGAAPDAAHEADLRWRRHRTTESTFAPIDGVDPTDLAQTGWALVVPDGLDPAVLEALEPLVEHRREQAAAVDERRCRVITASRNESKPAFLRRLGAGPGAVDPAVVPYYLLLVGEPGDLSFGFQYQLDVAYAVGRVAFDSADAYAAYAASVVRAERNPRKGARHVGVFAPINPDDLPTARSTALLARPLADAVRKFAGDVVVDDVLGEEATTTELGRLLATAPSVLFTATHGVGMPCGHNDQRARQGALVGREWPGPHAGSFDPAWCFAADDVDTAADLTGMISFHFACYSAGTPRHDDYTRGPDDAGIAATQREIAAAPFVAALPQRLLASPGGGALAAVGHVERAWGYSFDWPGAGRQTGVYESTLRRLLDGHPLGSALEPFNQRYAELASDLLVELEEVAGGQDADDVSLAATWTARNDARAFVIVGDPAVRLPTPAKEAA